MQAGSAPAKVVGLGSCGLDYLAQVAAFPQPDEKLRTERLEVLPSLRPSVRTAEDRAVPESPQCLLPQLGGPPQCLPAAAQALG